MFSRKKEFLKKWEGHPVYSVLNTNNNNTIYVDTRNKRTTAETSKQTKKFERRIKTFNE